MKNDIKVSIICNAFNHEDYIKDALESFIMQKTNFKFEVLIHDDASADNTANIIREYEEKYPDIIKPIYQTVNQYSQRIPIGVTYQIPRAKGKYIAVCEGDDFWTDPYKLQKQYDALELHPEVDMCAHSAVRIQAVTKEKLGEINPSGEDTVLTVEEVIKGGGGYLATNSLMYRKELITNPPPFRLYLQLDYTLQILGALRGGILYLKDKMSAYRVLSKDSWTSRVTRDEIKYREHIEKLCRMLKILNDDTARAYERVINDRISQYRFVQERKFNNYKEMLRKEYKVFFKKLSFKNRLKIRLKAYFPCLIKVNKNK